MLCLLSSLKGSGKARVHSPLQARSSGASRWGRDRLGGGRCSRGGDTVTGGCGLDYFLPLSLPTEIKKTL